jgi:hypothetical protein
MSLASRLLGLGISVENTVGQIGIRTGAVPLQWPVGQFADSVIYRLPRDPHERASLLATRQLIVVNEGETALVLEDGIQVTSNGVAFVRVHDGARFLTEAVQGATQFSEVDLQRVVMPRVQSVLRTAMTRASALQLQSERESLTATVRQALTDPLDALGISLVDFEVIEVGLPSEFKAAVAGATLARHAGGAQLVQAEIDARTSQIAATARAQAELTAGMANVQLLGALQERGIDPLRMKALEALQTFAETPSSGGLMGDAFKAQLLGQVAGAALGGLPTYAASAPLPLPMLPGVSTPALDISAHMGGPASPTGEPLSPAPSEATSGSAAGSGAQAATTAADLQHQIDGLTARLADGTLSEDTYNRLVPMLEKRLAEALRA